MPEIQLHSRNTANDPVLLLFEAIKDLFLPKVPQTTVTIIEKYQQGF